MSVLDPYALLGVTIGSTEAEAREAFRNLALIVHPDKGGRADEMQVLLRSYRYVTGQLALIDRSGTAEERERAVEQSFADFCESQVAEENMRPDWLVEMLRSDRGAAFDGLFDRLWAANQQSAESNPAIRFECWDDEEGARGYGAHMDPSEYADLDPASAAAVTYSPRLEPRTAPASELPFSLRPPPPGEGSAVIAYVAPASVRPNLRGRLPPLSESDYGEAFLPLRHDLEAVDDADLPSVSALYEALLAERGPRSEVVGGCPIPE